MIFPTNASRCWKKGDFGADWGGGGGWWLVDREAMMWGEWRIFLKGCLLSLDWGTGVD